MKEFLASIYNLVTTPGFLSLIAIWLFMSWLRAKAR